MEKFRNKPELVRWEPIKGQMYAVLFGRLLEIFSVLSDEPLQSVSFDCNQTSFDFISTNAIAVGDQKGRLTVFQDIDKEDDMTMQIVETENERIKYIRSSPDLKVFLTVTNEGISMWNKQSMLDEMKAQSSDFVDKEKQDFMFSLKPMLNFDLKARVL
jgi:hypothetical protein